MSRKNKAFRAFIHQNPNPTAVEAWDAAWANQQSCFQSKRMQEQDARIVLLEAAIRKHKHRKWGCYRPPVFGADKDLYAVLQEQGE